VIVSQKSYLANDQEFCGGLKTFREVAGAGTKGRYDQRLPSVSFALGLNVCLIDTELCGYQVNTVFYDFIGLLWAGKYYPNVCINLHVILDILF
jgi:hypothetical protein